MAQNCFWKYNLSCGNVVLFVKFQFQNQWFRLQLKAEKNFEVAAEILPDILNFSECRASTDNRGTKIQRYWAYLAYSEIEAKRHCFFVLIDLFSYNLFEFFSLVIKIFFAIFNVKTLLSLIKKKKKMIVWICSRKRSLNRSLLSSSKIFKNF